MLHCRNHKPFFISRSVCLCVLSFPHRLHMKVWILKSKPWSSEERRSGYRSGKWTGRAPSLSLTRPDCVASFASEAQAGQIGASSREVERVKLLLLLLSGSCWQTNSSSRIMQKLSHFYSEPDVCSASPSVHPPLFHNVLVGKNKPPE